MSCRLPAFFCEVRFLSNRVIQLSVEGSYIKYTGGSDGGATGSHNAVTLRMQFNENWDGTSKTVYFTDALGEKSVSVVLGLDRLVDGTTDTYDVAVPSEALAVAGCATVTVKGVVVSGDTVSRAITTAAGKFRVLDAEIPESAGNAGTITPSEKDQLQAEIDALAPMFTAYKEAAERSEAAWTGLKKTEVVAVTVPSSSEAAAIKTQIGDHFHIRFEIPRGAQGNPGPEGKQGKNGADGPAGPAGKDAAVVAADGQYAFQVNSAGHLILTYTGDTAPNFFINDDGHLILTI